MLGFQEYKDGTKSITQHPGSLWVAPFTVGGGKGGRFEINL